MWNFAKSAEEILSRFILKRICKFLLKKKLGQFILGDIDIDQLDVQIAAGTLQLADLALNVDFLNQKLGEASMFKFQEGSIRSLLVKMPWNSRGCEVEVDELEIVLSPCNEKINEVAGNHDISGHFHTDHVLAKDEHRSVFKFSAASVNVHEGVKTVAKMVKWLLTSFHIKLKNVIVAFDTCTEKDEVKEGFHETLVLRIAEIECGTCVSEGRNSPDDTKAEDFLGISHLTNFLKFGGASVELLQMNGDYNKMYPVSPDDMASGSRFPSTCKPLLTGERGGFCGSLKLSIPWKNGSLDISRVDAEVTMDPLLAKLQPSTLKRILVTWEMLEKHKIEKVDIVYHTVAEPVFSGLTSHSYSFGLPSSMLNDETLIQGKESSIECSVPFGEATMNDVLLEEAHLISDWMPSSIGKWNAEDNADLGASVDQFFECFDGIRSSQSVLGSSGLWAWTSSVFNAITAASNLASGSLNISTEQHHVQTNLNVNLLGVSMVFSFLDEDQLVHQSPVYKQVDIGANINHMGMKCENIEISVQVYPQEWKLEAVIKHIILDHYLSRKDTREFDVHYHGEGVNTQTLMIQDLQNRVHSTLPSSSWFPVTFNADISETSTSGENSGLFSAESCACKSNIVKEIVFETSGATMFAVSSKSSDGCSAGKASFSLKLPPFIFWLNFDLVKVVLDFSRELQNSPRKSSEGTCFLTKATDEKNDSSAHSDTNWGQYNHVTSGKRSLHGNVYLSHARIILCFSFKNGVGLKNYSSCDQFVALDFSSPLNFKKLNSVGTAAFQEDRSLMKDNASTFCSLHLYAANLDIYHITRDCDNFDGLSSPRFCALKFLCLHSEPDWVRLISMHWQDHAVTGAWIIESAKLLATSDDSASKGSSTTCGYEFASVSTKKDMEDLSSQKRKEMISSSVVCLHVCLSKTVVTLSRSQYLCFFQLLNEVINAFSSVGSDTSYDDKETIVNQMSVFLECASIELQIELDWGNSPTGSLQRELPGLWEKLRLEVQNLSLLSVSDIGSVSGASFLWISHSEGKLWGSISTLDQDLILISYGNGSRGRGNGEGSNVLSCRPAGFDFIHLCDPRVLHNWMSITVKCGTIVAPGGRLDWMEKVSSFFSLSSPEMDNCNSQKKDSQKVSFVLKFIDAALSYEPYSGDSEGLRSKTSCSDSLHEDPCDPYVACLLAASSLTFSTRTITDALENVYSIRFQDVGLLLRAVSEQKNVVVEYGVEHLRELGYVKVVEEALIDAVLRITFESDVFWELSCSKSHIILSTCHDTTFGLMRLASQIQQLFAPDVEESIVHLQNRWNSLQQSQGKGDPKGDSETSSDCSPIASQVQQLSADSKDKPGLFGLMDEISEDAFKLGGKGANSIHGSRISVSVDRILHNEGPSFCVTSSGNFLEGCDLSNAHNAEIIEGYCLSGLRPLSELTINSHFPEEIPKLELVSSAGGDIKRGSGGWYARNPLRIMEDYVSDEALHSVSKQLSDVDRNNEELNGSKRCKGRLLLGNIEVKWRMYAGSDWHAAGKAVRHSRNNSGRDETCLELAISKMNIQYDVFPDGDVCVSKLCLSVQDFFLYDSSRRAPWKLVVGYYSSKERPRESSSKAFKLDLETVRPDPIIPLEEYRLCVAFLPILLHLHQSQLDFLIAFFGGKRSSMDLSRSSPQDTSSLDVISGKDNSKIVGIADEALLPFFQKFDILPSIVRVDYQPSRVDLAALSGGKYVELVNLVPWKGVELQLKHVQAAGVYGWSNICGTAAGEWLEDISQNQIHKLLQGLSPIRSFVAVGSGAAKLVSLPVNNYKKEHRLVKGLQRGTVAFLRSISVEALGLGVHLAAGAHEILLHAECILTHIQPSVPRPIRGKLEANPRIDRPEDAQRGLQQAYENFTDGLGKTTSALIHSPLKTYQRGGGVGSALVTAVRGAPVAAVAPAAAAAQALHSALLGVRNSLDPEHKEKSKIKYFGPSHSQDQS